MKSTLTKEKAATMTPKQLFEYRLFEPRHDKQLPDCRRLYLAIPEKVGFWARVLRRLRGVK